MSFTVTPLTWPEHVLLSLVQHLHSHVTIFCYYVLEADIKNAAVAIQSRRIFW